MTPPRTTRAAIERSAISSYQKAAVRGWYFVPVRHRITARLRSQAHPAVQLRGIEVLFPWLW